MADPFVEQLKRLCLHHPYAAKWVLVPSPSIGWTLGERLLHEGCDWVNLRFTTPFQLALEAAAPELLARGIHPCPDALGPGLLQNLLLDLPEDDFSHFRPLVLQPGMAQAIWSTLSEFRMTGLPATAIGNLAYTPKRRELFRLFAAYEAHLREQNWADRADVLSSGLPITDIRPDDIVLPYAYCCWSPLEQQFIEKLPGQRWLPEATEQAPPSFWPPRQAVPVQGRPPSFFSAPRRQEEIDEIVRRVLQNSIPLDQVEICALPEEALLIQERLSGAGFPSTFEAGLPALCGRPGQALNGILTWIEQGYTAYHLREVLLSDLLRLPPQSFTAARLLQSARITWGRETYRPRLQILLEIYAGRELEEGVKNVQALLEGLQAWWQRLPAGDAERQVPKREWLSGLQAILKDDFIPRNSAEDGSRQTILSALEELKSLPGRDWPLSRLLLQVRQGLQALVTHSSRSQAGHVHVTRPAMLGISGRPHLFLIGLEEGRWLTTQPQDCVLSDEERAALHPGFRLSRDLPEFMLFQLLERMATVAGELTLSFSVRDRAGEKEQLPSWVFFDCVRRYHPQVGNFRQLLEWLGDPVAPPPVPTLSEPGLAELYPDLTRASHAELQRDSERFTEFDGHVPEAAGLWDPRSNAVPISVSRLSALATCPFQFFLEEGLHLSSGVPTLPDSDVWLDPSTRGILLHDILADYHRRLRAHAKADLLTLLKQHVEKLKQLWPAPSAALEQAEVADLERDLLHFLQLEQQNPERRPMALELPFGMEADPLEPLSRAGLLELDLGDGSRLPVRGRIDRVDHVEGGFAVVDYKTGRSLRVHRNAVYDRGRLLQHGLYALVVEQLLGPVAQSSYYFIRPGAQQTWVHFPSPQPERLLRVLKSVLEPLASGAFAHTHEREKDCQYCSYSVACQSHSDSRQRRKLEHLENTMLHSRRRLLEED